MSGTGHASFSITAVNDAPAATNLTQTLTLAEDAASVKLFTTGPSISDIDSENVTATLALSSTAAGVLVGAGTGVSGVHKITGTPAALSSALAGVMFVSVQDFNGTASVTVAISDGANGPQGSNPSGTVSITVTSVNDAPIANADTLLTIAEDAGIQSVAFTALTGNDAKGPVTATDESTQILTLTGVSAAIGGSVAIVSAHVQFTPTANYNGPAGFDYTIQDNGTDNGGANPLSGTGHASFSITAVNDAPVATDDALSSVAEDSGQRTISFANLLGNDSTGPANESGQTLTISNVGNAVGGTVSISGSNVLFTPTANSNGAASFDYTVQDNGTTNGSANFKTDLGSASFTVTDVNDAPVATDDSLSSVAEDSGERTISFSTLLANDSTGPANESGQTLTISNVGNAVGGTVSISGSNVLFTPTANFNGAASFDYTVQDNGTTNGGADFKTDVGTVAFGMTAVNDAPVATDDVLSSVAEDSGQRTISFASLVSNDSQGPANESGQTLTITNVGNAVGGTVLISGSNVVFTPTANFNGAASFDYTVQDNGATDGSADAKTDVGSVSFAVTAVNDAPVAQNGLASGDEDTIISGSLIASDVDGDFATFTLRTQALNGFVTVNANGTFDYTPNANFSGTDSFAFAANDGAVDSDAAVVTVTINAVNDPPVITSDGGAQTAAVSVLENTTAVTTIVAADPDSSLAYSIGGGNDAAKFQINALSGELSFVTAPDFEIPGDADHNNTYIVQVSASDGSLSQTQSITVSVLNASDSIPTVHWSSSVPIGPHPAGWLPSGIADFNNDGRSDLAWYNASNGDLEIWKIENGQWAGSTDIGSHPSGWQPAGFADFTNDGTSDALWYNPATQNLDLWKIENGQWAGSVNIGSHPSGWQPAGIGDFNNDGTSDVLWYNQTTGNAEIWKTQNGQWAGSVDLGSHPAGWQASVVGDFNGDGSDDIAWYNASTGNIDIWKIVNGQWAGSVDLGSHPSGWQPLGAGKFNADATDDLAWYNPTTNTVETWLISNGQWAGSVDVGSHPAGSVAVGVGDFDQNGMSDIMWRNTSDNSIDTWLLAYS